MVIVRLLRDRVVGHPFQMAIHGNSWGVILTYPNHLSNWDEDLLLVAIKINGSVK